MGEVVTLPPKTVAGKRGSVEYSLIFNKADRMWDWRVTVPVAPQVFTGRAGTQALAQQQVDNIVNNATGKRTATR